MKNLVSNLLFFMMLLSCIMSKPLLAQEKSSQSERIFIGQRASDEKSDAGVGKFHQAVEIAPSQHATYDVTGEKPITIVYPVVMPPYTFKDDTGRAQGLAVDLLRLWSKKTGIPIRFTSAPWNQGLEMMRDGKADIHASLYYTEERDAYMDYAAVVASSAGSIFYHKNIIDIGGSEDLRAYRVGAVRGGYHEQYVQEHLPKVPLVSYPEFPEMLMAAQKGDIRVFIEDVGATIYRLKQRGLLDKFRYDPAHPLYRNNFWIAVRQGDTKLAQALKHGMALITPEERATIERKWMGTSALKTQDTLFVAMYNDFAPFTFINAEGRPAGLFVDIWQLWAKKTGKKIEFVAGNWKDSLNSLKQGNADIHSGLFYSDARAQWLNYSQPFYETGSCFFYPGKQKEQYKQDSYAGKKVGVIKGSYHEEHLRKEHPTVDVILFESMEKMLRALLNGEISACLTEYSSATDLINRLGLSGMFNADPDILFTKNFYAGVIKGNSELLALVDEGFEAITNHELAGIEEHWVLDPGKRYFKEADGKIHLTESEKAWLKAHPDIQLGYTDIFEPEVIVNPNGSYSGMLVDFLDALNTKLGTDIGLRIDSIPKIFEEAKTKEVDGILNIHPEYADSLGLLKTRGHWPGYPTVFARRNAYFDGPDDFRGKRVAIIDKVYFSEKLMRQYGKQATILKVDNALEGLRSVSKGDADFFLGASFNSYFITKYQLLDVFPTYIFLDYPEKFGIAIRPDWPQLVSILNKGISSFSEEEIGAIVAKWVHLPQQKEMIELTAEEKAWLDKHHTIRVSFWQHPPFFYSKDGKVVGIAVDLLNAISKNTGIKFQIKNRLDRFSDVLKGLKEHEGPDLVGALMPTTERENSIRFTIPYFNSPRFIFTRDDAPFVSSIESLSGKKIAVVKDYVVHRNLVEKYPGIDLLISDTSEEALRAVSMGEAFAFIGDLVATPEMINEFGLNNLKAACPSGLPDHPLAIGIRNDWPELRDILNKALDAIPAAEKAAIINKWSTVRVEHGIRRADVLKWILVVGGSASGIVLLFLFWNRTLAKRVKERTSELSRSHKLLEDEVDERTKAEELLRESRDYLKNLTDSMPDAIFSIKLPERIIEWANDTFRTLGYEPDECVGRTTDFLYPSRDEFIAFGDKMARAITDGQEVFCTEQNMVNKSGDVFPAEITLSFFKTKGDVVRVTAIVRNIAERKQKEQQLQEYQGRLKALAAQLTLVEEKERRRIAADLHDQIGQSLVLARMQIVSAKKSATDAGLTAKLDDISETLREAVHDTRHLMFELSSPTMHSIGLRAAISEWLEEEMGKRYNLKTKFIDKIDEGQAKVLDENVRAILFRNVRELLVNVVKHAQASQVSILMEHTNDALKIVVQDDGIGFDSRELSQTGGITGGFGLFSIEERMSDLGGVLEIQSQPGKGCKAILTVPLRSDDDGVERN